MKEFKVDLTYTVKVKADTPEDAKRYARWFVSDNALKLNVIEVVEEEK